MSETLVVRRAGFAPVKGMRHLALDAVQLDGRGPVGDRTHCLVDVAQRRVLRTVQHPMLMSVEARAVGAGLALTLPDGRVAAGPATPTGETLVCDYWGRRVGLALTDGPHAALMSDLLGKDVRLAAAPRGEVVFGELVSMVTTASLDALGDDIQEQSARFRATFVVETDEPWAEDTWGGREVTLGDAVVRVGGPIPRCAVIDHDPVTGVKDRRLLTSLVRQRPTNDAGEPIFGVYATCVVPGWVPVTP